MVTAQCPYCFATDEVPDEYAGRVTKCLTCEKTFTIKFVPALYRESATPVVVTPKKAIHMGLSSGKPKANGNAAAPAIDAQSQEIFAEITQGASSETPETAEASRPRSRRKSKLVDELDSLESALTLVKAVAGLWIVALLAFCVYTAINAQYIAAGMALGTIALLAVGLYLLRVADEAFTNVVRAVIDVQKRVKRSGQEGVPESGL